MAAAAICGVVVLLTAMRQTSELPLQNVLLGLYERVFVLPFETGAYTIAAAEQYNFFQGDNIRPLAILRDTPYLNLSNKIYLDYYHRDGLPVTGSANTCFLFDFQASFGIVGGWLAALGASGPQRRW